MHNTKRLAPSWRSLTTLFACLLGALPPGGELRAEVYDVVVVEGTPGGVACAVRAARQGCRVLLVNRTDHLGGMLSSGLGVWDTLWEGRRSPIYDTLRQGLFDHYRATYGEDSPQYRHALPDKSGHRNGKFEPHAIEKLITDLVAAESNIEVLKGYVPIAAQRDGRRLTGITVQQFRGADTKQIRGKVFADCSYEGDLLPLANVKYGVGRESRDEFHEPHAGVIYLRRTEQRTPLVSAAQLEARESLPLRKFKGFQETLSPESTGAGDSNVQAFNYRTTLTSDPANRVPIEKPRDYDPAKLADLEYSSRVRPIPNQKLSWNRPQLVGPHQAYVEGDWDARQAVMDAHWDATMALLWYLQHDPNVPKKERAYWLKFGLAKDEFADNGHRPYEIYVREARRLRGRYVLSQRDLMPKQGTQVPKHADAIAMTDWYMDSHAVTKGSVRGSLDDGKMMLHAETWPGQIPYRCLLPVDLDNVLVPVCLSSTHVAWGAVRLEPTWLQTGEAAGYAAAMAIENDQPPEGIDVPRLVDTLRANGFLIDFYTQQHEMFPMESAR